MAIKVSSLLIFHFTPSNSYEQCGGAVCSCFVSLSVGVSWMSLPRGPLSLNYNVHSSGILSFIQTQAFEMIHVKFMFIWKAEEAHAACKFSFFQMSTLEAESAMWEILQV